MPASILASRSTCRVTCCGGAAPTSSSSKHRSADSAASCAAMTGSAAGCARAVTPPRSTPVAASAGRCSPPASRPTADWSNRWKPDDRGRAGRRNLRLPKTFGSAGPEPCRAGSAAMAYIDDPTTQKANLSFIKASMRTPLLSRDREFELARRWREGGDTAALHELVRAYTRLVIASAGRFRSYGLPLGDLVHERRVGLVH